MANEEFNIAEKAKEINTGMSELPVNDRLSFFEHEVEAEVRLFRKKLNGEVIKQAKAQLAKEADISCGCGNKLKPHKEVKKNFFSNMRNWE